MALGKKTGKMDKKQGVLTIIMVLIFILIQVFEIYQITIDI
jgi:hypothetical protein